jgi:hypothetical protein
LAIYLTHKYGERFYGPEPALPSFDAERFISYSSDYRTVRLTWEPPVGVFDRFRLVKGLYGLPQSEIDGEVLIDAEVPDVGYADTDVEPGHFYYYGVFLKIGGVWTPAGYSSCLHIVDLGSTQWLWTRLPNHYRLLRGNHLTLEADENLALLRYMAVIGWGLDRVRTGIRASWSAADVETTHETLVDLITEQLGLPTYPGLTGLRRRAIARDGVALAASKGTTQSLEAIMRTASGWDVVVRPGRNMLGSYDRSRMHNPLPAEWDASIHYAVGRRVYFYGVSYICISPAYSYDQMPDGEGFPNTWWERLSRIEADTVAYDSATASQHGWQGMSHTVGQPDTKVQTRLALGIPSVGDTVIDTNAVTVHNTHVSALDAGVRLLPVAQDLPTPDPLTVITNAVPLPMAAEWDIESTYRYGAVVSWRGRTWRAVRPPLVGQPPHLDVERWEPVNTDNRLRLCLSAYTHQPHTDPAKASVPVRVYMEFYDDRGRLISREFGNATDSRVLDTFTVHGDDAIAALGGRVTEYGAKTWVDRVPGFVRDSYTFGSVRPTAVSTRALSTVSYASANATVSATFATAPAAGQVQALILRYVSDTSYLRATRTALQTVDGGVISTLVTYSTPIGDGDRLTVTANGNNYAVKRNNTQVATTTSAFNASSTVFGLAVEAS